MRLAFVILSLILVAGCGGSTETDPTSPDGAASGANGGTPGAATPTPGDEFLPPNAEESAAALPPCSDVWAVGKTLPEDYEGCQTADGGLDKGAVYACTDGKGDLVGQDEQFFARVGGPIQANGDDDEAFSQELFEVCKPK